MAMHRRADIELRQDHLGLTTVLIRSADRFGIKNLQKGSVQFENLSFNDDGVAGN